METDAVPLNDLKRLLKDSRESTCLPEEELSFIRTTLSLLIVGIPYEDALQHAYAQIDTELNRN